MEAADRDRDIGLAELAGDIERARILIGLNADQRHEAAAGLANVAHRLLHVDDGVALVIGFDFDVDIGTERERFGAFAQQAIDAGEAVGRNGRAPPLDDIAVGVVMRRLDQDDLELATRGRPSAVRALRLRNRSKRPVAWPFAQKTRISGPAQATIEHSRQGSAAGSRYWPIRSRDGRYRRNWCRFRRPSRSAFRLRRLTPLALTLSGCCKPRAARPCRDRSASRSVADKGAFAVVRIGIDVIELPVLAVRNEDSYGGMACRRAIFCGVLASRILKPASSSFMSLPSCDSSARAAARPRLWSTVRTHRTHGHPDQAARSLPDAFADNGECAPKARIGLFRLRRRHSG